MSALIIRAHVKDGVEMAREHRLPERLIDFIPQHHGTALISFFYDKAVREAEEGEEVDESHYRYPGPRPQTKEAGILMLADGVEAASRALADPAPAKIQGLVQKMINKVFASGQLDESELTLKDLHLIAKSFTRVLTGIFHRRVEYPETTAKPDNTVKIAEYLGRDGDRADTETESSRRAASLPTEGAAAQGAPKALRRLGM
jgi:membrane-associated HD superfamily phosphohydrolase